MSTHFIVRLFTLTPSLLEKLEQCQLWFIRNKFYVARFTTKQLLLKLSGLNSIESEIAIKKMLFLGILGAKTAPAVGSLFESITQSYFDTNIDSKGVLPSICKILHKYDLFGYFDSWFSDSTFPTYLTWKIIVMRKIHELRKKHGIILSMAIQPCKLPKLALRVSLRISFGLSVSNTQTS